jgi:hypothetical protein
MISELNILFQLIMKYLKNFVTLLPFITFQQIKTVLLLNQKSEALMTTCIIQKPVCSCLLARTEHYIVADIGENADVGRHIL